MDTLNETLNIIMDTIEAPTILLESYPQPGTDILIVDMDVAIKPMFDPFELGQLYYEWSLYQDDLNESSNYCASIRDSRESTSQRMVDISNELHDYGYGIFSRGGRLELSIYTDIDTYTAENVENVPEGPRMPGLEYNFDFEDDHNDYLNSYTVIKTYGPRPVMQDHTPEYNEDGELLDADGYTEQQREDEREDEKYEDYGNDIEKSEKYHAEMIRRGL